MRSLDWSSDGPRWPHHEHSRFVEVGGLRWHVQRFAPGGVDRDTAKPCRQQRSTDARRAPLALLLHGTGASSHSWRLLAPRLAASFEVLVVDLPGHAFTQTPLTQPLSLPGMANAIATLLDAGGDRPALVVGHSAGAAIGAQLCLRRRIAPAALVALNGALLPLHGIAGRLFTPLARLLAAQPLVPRLFAWRAAKPAVLQRLLDSTGSHLDAEGRRLYACLVADAGHAAGALRMMASWDLQALMDELPQLPVPLHLLAGAADRTVPCSHSLQVRRIVAGPPVQVLPRLGHLAHEEDAGAVMGAMADATASAMAAPAAAAVAP